MIMRGLSSHKKNLTLYYSHCMDIIYIFFMYECINYATSARNIE